MTPARQLASLSAALAARVDELAEAVVRRTEHALPAAIRDPGLRDALVRGVRDHAACAARELGGEHERRPSFRPALWTRCGRRPPRASAWTRC